MVCIETGEELLSARSVEPRLKRSFPCWYRLGWQ